MPTVHVVSDVESGRQNATHILRKIGYDFELHHSALRFLESLSNLNPGCLLVDKGCYAFMDGAALQEELVLRHAVFPMIVAVRPQQISLAVRAMKAGAFGIIEHPYDADVLEGLIDAALEHAEESRRLRREQAEQERKLNSLSRRERDVLRFIVTGSPSKVAAYQLGISLRTIEIHRANLMKKLSCHSLAQATVLALRSGFCPPWDSSMEKLNKDSSPPPAANNRRLVPIRQSLEVG